MMLTEVEARKIKCCDGGGTNNDPGDACIASECMAWRWIAKGAKIGYCGLAGIPRELTVQ